MTPPEKTRLRRDDLRHALETTELQTPAFVYDAEDLLRTVGRIAQIAQDASSALCYSLKACSVPAVLELIAPSLDGFSCSSPFEARLASQLRKPSQAVHFTSPGLRPDDFERLLGVCDYLAFNSVGQWQRFRSDAAGRVACGLRVNPELPLVEDNRYNPCRPHSKLGVPLSELEDLWAGGGGGVLDGISGVHFHSNCDAESCEPWLRTVKCLDRRIPGLLRQVDWVNLGGGYVFPPEESSDPFYRAVDLLRDKYNVQVFLEPGSGLVRDAGYLVATVVDLFVRGGRRVAVLDASVNHLPEVFEYQFQLDVAGAVEDGANRYLLAGASCLAGDLFGDYGFEIPLQVGRRVVFEQAGAYSVVKAHQFNGINLPNIYIFRTDGRVDLIKTFGYIDFVSRAGGGKNAAD